MTTDLPFMPDGLLSEEVTSPLLSLMRGLFEIIFPDEDPDNDCFEQSLTDPTLTYWIHSLEGQPVGISGLYEEKACSDSAWLGWFGVLPGRRSKGIGSAILSWHERLVASRGFKFSRLYTDPSNTTAIRFYEKHGYIGEKYSGVVPDEVSRTGQVLIFSKTLAGNTLEPWNDRPLEF